jgi:hypothetical protein
MFCNDFGKKILNFKLHALSAKGLWWQSHDRILKMSILFSLFICILFYVVLFWEDLGVDWWRVGVIVGGDVVNSG